MATFEERRQIDREKKEREEVTSRSRRGQRWAMMTVRGRTRGEECDRQTIHNATESASTTQKNKDKCIARVKYGVSRLD
jgi:hypothetical protein